METETETLPRPLVLTSYEIDKLRELVDFHFKMDNLARWNCPLEESSLEEFIAWGTLKNVLEKYDRAGKMLG